MQLEYYDKILAGIAVSLGLGTATGYFSTLPIQYTIAVGAAIAIGFMYHGMFQKSP